MSLSWRRVSKPLGDGFGQARQQTAELSCCPSRHSELSQEGSLPLSGAGSLYSCAQVRDPGHGGRNPGSGRSVARHRGMVKCTWSPWAPLFLPAQARVRLWPMPCFSGLLGVEDSGHPGSGLFSCVFLQHGDCAVWKIGCLLDLDLSHLPVSLKAFQEPSTGCTVLKHLLAARRIAPSFLGRAPALQGTDLLS